MPRWVVTGAFAARRATWQPFAKHCEAPTSDQAREWVLSEIGGCHGVKRASIRIESVAEEAA